MELVRNEKLNGIELHMTKKDNTLETLNTIRELGWHWSQRKGHFYHLYDEALIASTKAAFPSLDKKVQALQEVRSCQGSEAHSPCQV